MSTNATLQNNDLKVLVEELSKTNPKASLIKTKADILGIPYSADLIVLMSDVLVYISKYHQSSNSKLREEPA